MHLIFLSLLLQTGWPLEIEVKYHLHHYKIQSSENEIHLQGQLTKLNLVKTKCNEHIIKNLHAKLSNYLKSDFLNDEAKNTYEITIDQKKHFDFTDSKRGDFFLNFEKFFKTLKIEEKFNCKE